jgi:hypothetical protein
MTNSVPLVAALRALVRMILPFLRFGGMTIEF